MMQLFHKTTQGCSQFITEQYSTSFTLGIKTLDHKYHAPIYGIYGFVRFADEIVDTFYDFDQKTLLDEFKADTYKAIQQGISLNPVLHSFQMVVNQYQIEHELIEAFLHSMAMDLYCQDYNEDGYQEYIYGSAEVVGLLPPFGGGHYLVAVANDNRGNFESPIFPQGLESPQVPTTLHDRFTRRPPL